MKKQIELIESELNDNLFKLTLITLSIVILYAINL
jgi:hypothetical protein